jgi:hypothetical protein
MKNLKSNNNDMEMELTNFGEKVIDYTKKYEGTSQYNAVMEAIGFGY